MPYIILNLNRLKKKKADRCIIEGGVKNRMVQKSRQVVPVFCT